MIDDYLETDLTPDLCPHLDVEATPDGAVCNDCTSILYTVVRSDAQEDSQEVLPEIDDLDDNFDVNL
jgi:hypothetical protein